VNAEEVRIDIPIGRAGYDLFIGCKRLATYRVEGRTVITDATSYAAIFGGDIDTRSIVSDAPHLMDFQTYLVQRALDRRRFAIFADCGLGKTAMFLAWAHAVEKHGKVLILCPLAVLKQIKRESERFHGTTLVDLRAGEAWTSGLAIMNYESRRDIDMRGVAGIILDESSILKNDAGETRDFLISLSANIPYRLATSATPAPNDHAEYASHAVFLGYARTAKEFYSQFFRKDGTDWILRGHAIEPFYRNLSAWSTYIHSPRALGFKQTTEMGDEPDYVFQNVPVHSGFKPKSGNMFASAESAEDRSAVFGELRSTPGPRLSAIGEYLEGKRGIIWCGRNAEEDAIRHMLGKDVPVVNGAMPVEERVEIVDAYRAGSIRHIISKPKVLGFGVNIPECDHMVYSGFGWSFEQVYQAVRRAHRYGRKGRLEVMFPFTDPEAPVLQVLREKMDRFSGDVQIMQGRFWRG
jgi:superfamily II DNA or RNA helicase